MDAKPAVTAWPGVEIFANVLQTLASDRHIVAASTAQNLAFNLAPLVVVLLSLLWLGPLGVFLLILSMLLAQTGVPCSPSLAGSPAY